MHKSKLNRLTLAKRQISVRHMEQLLTDIRNFCASYGMPVTRFGEAAMGDTAFVHKLEKGRRVWPETEARARDYMAAYTKERAA